jgi:putative FmdB family regulatory protein
MPIYEYRCAACGFQKEYLQKMNAALLTDCPECGKATFNKMVTAAGFQLKGSGWYATDFKNSAKPKPAAESKSADKKESTTAKSDSPAPAAESKSTEAKPAAEPAAKKTDAAASSAPSGSGTAS